MVIIKNGDLLKATENIIAHQVNIDGSMGGGVARQIALKHPKVESEYKRFCNKYCNNYELLRGKVDITQENGKYIANIFSQTPYYNTDYGALAEALHTLKGFAKQEKLTLALPYGIGCGIAHGDWNKVEALITTVFKDYIVVLYKWEV